MTTQPENQSEDMSEQASRFTLALNPLVGLQPKDLMDGAQAIVRALSFQPIIATQHWMSFLGELGRIAEGKSEMRPQQGDKRFTDDTWSSSRLHQGLLQAYLAWGKEINEFIDSTTLSDIEKKRAHLFATIMVDALAPTNNFISNPAALRKLVDTGGKSAVSGLKNFIEDLSKNGGMPSQVDKSPFKVGENLAATPGDVVFRNEIIELIQYRPATETVWQRPIFITPPQINKFYATDLAPGKSLAEFLTKSGFTLFCVSWRNPTPDQRAWGLDAYVAALDEAVDAAREISGCDDITMMGSCSGGMTSMAYLGYLAGTHQNKVRNITLAVCVLDIGSAEDIALGSLITPTTMRAAKEASKLRGVLDGQELSRIFAWMRPNDLIWNYWVNNYLLGNEPPAFDILFWNADTTRLPAQLHSDFIDLYFTNPFVNPGKLNVNGVSINVRNLDVDGYVLAGSTDHITPWKNVFASAKVLGEDTTFVVSNSGHLQSLINPPTNPKASFVTGPIRGKDADTFLAEGARHKGSWWLHWTEWLKTRSGEQVPAPQSPGSARHPATGPSPGTYVFEP
jgi:polyhydroxyalkanoate synthase